MRNDVHLRSTAAALITALLLPLPLRTLGAEEAPACGARAATGLRFGEPMLVPGAIWRFRLLVDLTEPGEVGTIVSGTFSSPDPGADALTMAFDLPGERQILSADPFDGTISTLGIRKDSVGLDLAFTPPLVHFRYPFQVGDTWLNDLQFTGVMGGYPMAGAVTSTFRVLAEECLDTAAGSFPALVLENMMAFPSLGQDMVARLWVSADGLLLRRESWVNGVQTQIIELDSYEVPMEGRLAEMARELAGLEREVRAAGGAAAPPWWALLVHQARNARKSMAAAAQAESRREQRREVRRTARAVEMIRDASGALDLTSGLRWSRVTRGAATMAAHLDGIERDLRP